MPLGGGIYGNNRTMNGGGISMGPDGQWRQAPPPPPSYTAESAYPRAIAQQAGDYDSIMGGYRNLLNQQNPDYGDLMSRYRDLLNRGQNGPSHATYGETSQFNEAFGNARELARTGGLSDSDQASLRARGVSPIRAAYQNASRNMERQARLSGGRSANYNAAASRMAREQSESMAGAMNNVNAGIAEMVQRGRLTAAPIMGQLGNSSSERMNQVGMFNANADNRHGENMASILSGMSGLLNSDSNRRAEALRGMTSLYGTTPALVNTFGNQVQNNQQMAMQQGPMRGIGGGGMVAGGYNPYTRNTGFYGRG